MTLRSTQLTLLSEERPASRSAFRDYDADLLTRVAASQDGSLKSSESLLLGGLSGKTSPVFFQVNEDGLSDASSGGFPKSGISVPGGFLTLNTSEAPNGAVACTLSEIVESTPDQFSLKDHSIRRMLSRLQKYKRGNDLLAKSMDAYLGGLETKPQSGESKSSQLSGRRKVAKGLASGEKEQGGD